MGPLLREGWEIALILSPSTAIRGREGNTDFITVCVTVCARWWLLGIQMRRTLLLPVSRWFRLLQLTMMKMIPNFMMQLIKEKFTMDMAGSKTVNMPNSYALNMFKDFVPMGVFSEVNQGKLATEGKVEHKFDMTPHNQNMEEYSRMCRARTNKSMIKNRQIQVLDNDRGLHMRIMPGMVGLIASNSKEKKKAAPVKRPEVKNHHSFSHFTATHQVLANILSGGILGNPLNKHL